MDFSKTHGVMSLAVFFIFFLFFGCISGEDNAKNNPQIKNFLDEHSQSETSFYSYSRVLFDEEKEFWDRGCGNEIEYGEYNIFRAEDDSAILKALFNKSDNSLICVVITRKDDWNLFIEDPNLKKTCIEQKGIICKPNQACSAGFTKASNTQRCCVGACVDVNSPDFNIPFDNNHPVSPDNNDAVDYVPCSGVSGVVFCDSTQYCSKAFVDSRDNNIECGCAECTKKTCQQLGGRTCLVGSTCAGSIVPAPDAVNCCIGGCYAVDVNIIVNNCVENWVCTDFAPCVNELRTRTCTDVNYCGTQENKPQESISCSINDVYTCVKNGITVTATKNGVQSVYSDTCTGTNIYDFYYCLTEAEAKELGGIVSVNENVPCAAGKICSNGICVSSG